MSAPTPTEALRRILEIASDQWKESKGQQRHKWNEVCQVAKEALAQSLPKLRGTSENMSGDTTNSEAVESD